MQFTTYDLQSWWFMERKDGIEHNPLKWILLRTVPMLLLQTQVYVLLTAQPCKYILIVHIRLIILTQISFITSKPGPGAGRFHTPPGIFEHTHSCQQRKRIAGTGSCQGTSPLSETSGFWILKKLSLFYVNKLVKTH